MKAGWWCPITRTRKAALFEVKRAIHIQTWRHEFDGVGDVRWVIEMQIAEDGRRIDFDGFAAHPARKQFDDPLDALIAAARTSEVVDARTEKVNCSSINPSDRIVEREARVLFSGTRLSVGKAWPIRPYSGSTKLSTSDLRAST